MKIVFLPDGATPRQAIANVKPGEVFIMYADAAKTKQVAQVCRTEAGYFVAGPRYAGQFDNGAYVTMDQIVETDLVSMYNRGVADDRAHIYRLDTAEEAMDKLQQLFKKNKL